MSQRKPNLKKGHSGAAASSSSSLPAAAAATPVAIVDEPVASEDDHLTLLICSANIGNAKPGLKDIAAWVPEKGRCSSVTPLSKKHGFDVVIADGSGSSKKSKTKKTKDCFDLVVVGMQESTWSAAALSSKMKKQKNNSNSNMVDSERGNNNKDEDDNDDEFLNDPAATEAIEAKAKEDVQELESMIEKTLGTEYDLIAEKMRGQMRLVIFARRSINNKGEISEVQVKCENTGIGHVLANKGGIVMSLRYRQTRLSFMSAHLAAHEGDKFYESRLTNLTEILGGAKTHDRYDITISSHHTFILGDLNFRTRIPTNGASAASADGDSKEAVAAASVKQALKLVQKEDYRTLYSYDELQAGILKRDLLVEFQTLPCHFPPTFKVERQAGFQYKKQRTPSYTDRILFRSALPGTLKPLAYEPCPGFTTSDHKPIRGAFRILTNAAVDAKQARQLQTTAAANTSSIPPSLPLQPTCSYTVKFHNMSCTDLAAMDLTGTSDPYIVITWSDAMIATTKRGTVKWARVKDPSYPKTKPVNMTLNPTFQGEQFSLSFNGPVPAEAMMYVTVMDYDMANQDDLIGSIPINVRELAALLPPHGEPKSTTLNWERRLLRNGTDRHGTIRLDIDLVRHDQPLDVHGHHEKRGILQKVLAVLRLGKR